MDATIDKVLTDAQKKTFRERDAPGGFAAMPAPGRVMSVSTQVALKLTPEQRARLSDLQKAVDTKLEMVLTDDLKQRLELLRAASVRGRPGGAAQGRPCSCSRGRWEAPGCFGPTATARTIPAWLART